MPTNDNGNGEAQEATGDKTPESENNDDDLLSSIEDEELRERVQNRITQEAAQKKHWRKKAEKPDEPEQDDSNDNDSGGDNPDVSEVNERINRLEQNQKLARDGYSDKEIAEARAYANGKDMDVTEAIESDFVQSAITTMREKKQSQENTPRPSNRVHVKDDKTFSDVTKDQDATKSEKNAALKELVKQRTGRQGSSKNFS